MHNSVPLFPTLLHVLTRFDHAVSSSFHHYLPTMRQNKSFLLYVSFEKWCVYVCVTCICLRVCGCIHECSACRGQKRGSDLLELELQWLQAHWCGCREPKSSPPQEQKALLPVSHLSSPPILFLLGIGPEGLKKVTNSIFKLKHHKVSDCGYQGTGLVGMLLKNQLITKPWKILKAIS